MRFAMAERHWLSAALGFWIRAVVVAAAHVPDLDPFNLAELEAQLAHCANENFTHGAKRAIPWSLSRGPSQVARAIRSAVLTGRRLTTARRAPHLRAPVR